jgi:hypothetical protein
MGGAGVGLRMAAVSTEGGGPQFTSCLAIGLTRVNAGIGVWHGGCDDLDATHDKRPDPLFAAVVERWCGAWVLVFVETAFEKKVSSISFVRIYINIRNIKEKCTRHEHTQPQSIYRHRQHPSPPIHTQAHTTAIHSHIHICKRTSASPP